MEKRESMYFKKLIILTKNNILVDEYVDNKNKDVIKNYTLMAVLGINQKHDKKE